MLPILPKTNSAQAKKSNNNQARNATRSPLLKQNSLGQKSSSSESHSHKTIDDGYVGYYSDHSEINQDTRSISSEDLSSVKNIDIKKTPFKILFSKEDFLETFDKNYETLISFIKEKSEIIDIQEIEQTTDDDYSPKKLPYENSVIYGNPPLDKNVLYKQYIKGSNNKHKEYYGISLEILDKAKIQRQNWTPLQNAQRHYHGKQAPDGTSWHLSHALANFFHGPETSINVSSATNATKKGIIAQGNAQESIENTLAGFLKSDSCKKIDLRVKLTDYYTHNHVFDTRRIKIFGSDSIGEKNKKGQEIYTEVLLGEFYLKSDIKWHKESLENRVFSHKIKELKNILHFYNDTINDPTRQKSNKQYWDTKGFIAREHIAYKEKNTISSDVIPNQKNDLSDNKKMNTQKLKEGKHKNTNVALYPMIVFLKNKNQEPHKAISEILKEKYPVLSPSLQEDIKNKFNDICDLVENSKDTAHEASDIANTKDDVFSKLHDLHFYLVENKIITTENMRQFYAKEIADTNENDSVLAFKDTHSSEYIMSTLRASDKKETTD